VSYAVERLIDQKLMAKDPNLNALERRGVTPAPPDPALLGATAGGATSSTGTAPVAAYLLHDAQLAAVQSGNRKLTPDEFAWLWSALLERTARLGNLSKKFGLLMTHYDLDEAMTVRDKGVLCKALHASNIALRLSMDRLDLREGHSLRTHGGTDRGWGNPVLSGVEEGPPGSHPHDTY